MVPVENSDLTLDISEPYRQVLRSMRRALETASARLAAVAVVVVRRARPALRLASSSRPSSRPRWVKDRTPPPPPPPSPSPHHAGIYSPQPLPLEQAQSEPFYSSLCDELLTPDQKSAIREPLKALEASLQTQLAQVQLALQACRTHGHSTSTPTLSGVPPPAPFPDIGAAASASASASTSISTSTSTSPASAAHAPLTMRTLEELLEEVSSNVALALAVTPSMLLKPASSLVFLSPSQIDVLDQTLLAQAGALTEARLRQSRLQGEHGTGATWRRLQDMWAALEAVPEPRRDLESKEAAVVELGEAIEAAVERVLGATHEPASSLNLSIDMLLWPTEELARLAPRQLAALTRLVEAQRAVLQATRVSQARHQERAAAGDEQIRKTEIAKLKVEQALAQSLEEPGRL